ncbi:amidohydrolase family protein [Altericroceibacterium xinjiangense]|uniref:amidohydrolase family protein n=1 Tax=Altericroceibacterium xinjiangense TaxID=762261 RepID=UPI000F7F34B5|nr:amidohydrolase family protein [Altericroceibacterium xinjiangense]
MSAARRIAGALALASTALAAPLAAQDFAITNATVAIGDGGEPIENATVLVRGGKVVAAGAGVPVPAGIERIDGQGKWVTPGLFAAVSDLGLWDVEGVGDSNDTEADESPFNAALDVAPAINPLSEHIAISRTGGITRSSVIGHPGNSIFAGQGALIDLGADPQAVTRPRAFQYAVLNEQAGRIAGGSRVSAQALFRNALREARDYAARGNIPRESADPRMVDTSAERARDVLLTRFDAAALVPVVEGTQKLYLRVERAADIRSALALKQDFPKLDLVLVGATEGWMVAEDIARARVPVIARPLVDLPNRFEQLASTQSNIGRMRAAGVDVAIGGFIGPDNQPRWAPEEAGNLVALTRVPGATGLSWGQALAAITSVPARISGLGDTAGVLKPGALGDVVIWNGDPLELSSSPVRVFIEGVEQPLDNRQTRLRDRYRTPAPGALPKAYDW